MRTRMAWRNVWRRKRRTAITAASIAFGVLLALIFTGVGNASYSAMIDNGASMLYGHVTLHPESYLVRPEAEKYLKNANQLVNRLESVRGEGHAGVIRSIHPRITGQGMLATARESVAVQFLGVDPGGESSQSLFYLDALSKGEMLTDSGGRGVLLGAEAADDLGAQLGSRVVLTTTGADGEMVSVLGRVEGLFRTGVEGIDGGTILWPLDELRKELGYPSEAASLVAVNLVSNRMSGDVANHLQAVVDKSEVTVSPWWQTQPDLAGFVAVDRGMTQALLALIALLISLGILNTVLMGVMERKREFGILLALGMRPHQLASVVFMEAGLLAGLGCLGGAVLTVPLHLYLKHVGIDFTAFISEGMTAGGAVFDPMIHSALYPMDVVTVVAIVLILTAGATFYPAWKAGRVPPVQAMKDLA